MYRYPAMNTNELLPYIHDNPTIPPQTRMNDGNDQITYSLEVICLIMG